jgi:hypothetical protein
MKRKRTRERGGGGGTWKKISSADFDLGLAARNMFY